MLITTIAYKDGIIAYDSRITQGDTISSDDFNKHVLYKGCHYFLCGEAPSFRKFIALHNNNESGEDSIDPPEGCNVGALIVKDGELFTANLDRDGEYWCCTEPLDIPLAIGTGTDHALTAMDMGATAKQAVAMAIKRDVRSGGRVRTYVI